MANLTLPSTDRDWRRGVRPVHLAFEHRRAASILLLAVLGYGLAMLLASGVPLVELAGVIGAYLPLAAKALALVGCAYAATLLVVPSARQDIHSHFFWLVVAAIMVCLTFPFFGMFKQVVLPNRGFIWDAAFAHIGRMLFGASPWIFTHRVFGTVGGTRFLDNAYSFWIPIMFVLPFVAAVACTNSILRLRILASWFLTWVLIGSFAAWIFASAGPCYYNTLVGHDPSFADLQHRLAILGRAAAAEGHSIAALEFQPLLLQAYDRGGFGVAGGISAMPSMHVALAWLLAIIGWQRNWAWGVFASAYAFLIWIGSVHFGWHYFVDGPVAAIMVTAIWKMTRPFANALYPGE